MLREKDAILPWFDDIAATTFGVGDDWAAGRKSLDCGDTKGF